MYFYPVKINNLNTLSEWLKTQVLPPNTEDGFVGRIPREAQHVILEHLGADMNTVVNYNVLQGYFPSLDPITIHSDHSLLAGSVYRSLIIPIKNCEQLTWTWYKCVDENKIYQMGAEGRFNIVPMIPFDAAEAVESKLCDEPFVSDICTWPSLCNAGSEPAQLISIRILPWAQQDWRQTPSLPPLGADVIGF